MQKIFDNKTAYWVLFFSWCFVFLHLCSLDLYNPSLPAMTHDFHVSQRMTRGLVVTYLLGFALSQLIYGVLSDALGRKKMAIVSIFLLMLMNLLTATAHNAVELLIYRALTGVASGGCPVISRAILRDYFSEKRHLVDAFSRLNMLNSIAPAFAPMLGGWVQMTYGWRFNFITLSVLCLLGLVLVCVFFKETKVSLQPLDFKNRLIAYRGFFRHSELWVYSIISSLAFCCTMGYFTISPFIYQGVFNWTPLENGLIYVFYALLLSVGSFVTSCLLKKKEPETILLYSILGLITVSFVFLMLESWFGWRGLVFFSSCLGFFVGMIIPLGQSLSVFPFSQSVGAASAASGCIRMLCSSLWLLILLFFHIDTLFGLGCVFVANSLLIILSYFLLLGKRH